MRVQFASRFQGERRHTQLSAVCLHAERHINPVIDEEANAVFSGELAQSMGKLDKRRRGQVFLSQLHRHPRLHPLLLLEIGNALQGLLHHREERPTIRSTTIGDNKKLRLR